MAHRIVEAELRLPGKDNTAVAFDSVAKYLTSIANSTAGFDAVGQRARAAATGVSVLDKHAAELNRNLATLGKSDASKAAHQWLVQAGGAFRDAQSNVQRWRP